MLGKKIGDITRSKPSGQDDAVSKASIVYKIPCNGYQRTYFGETAHGSERRLTEHKAYLRQHGTSYALVVHMGEKGHLPR